MNSNSASLSEFIAPLINSLSAGHRRQLLRKIVTQLRTINQQRIKTQQNPDGSNFTPRKALQANKGLRHKRGPMFTKLRTGQHFRISVNNNEAAVGFSGRSGFIANQHQDGITDTSNRYPISTIRRQLLGITPEDEQIILTMVFKHLSDH